MHQPSTALLAAISLLACSGSAANKGSGGDTAAPPSGGGETSSDPAAEYGELEVGSDYKSYQLMNTEPFLSPTHGKRFVNVYVNDIGAEAYKSGSAIPVGTIIVKDSFENENGAPSTVAGPVFVMEKREAGFDSDNNDWWYALHWADIPESWQKRVGAERAYWRSPSKKVGYCFGCHNSYDRELGMVPDEFLVGGAAGGSAATGEGDGAGAPQ